jgi:hypothetical protein
MKAQLIASASTMQGIQEMLNKFFYSTTFKVADDLTITNSKGTVNSVYIEVKKGRYYLRMY